MTSGVPKKSKLCGRKKGSKRARHSPADPAAGDLGAEAMQTREFTEADRKVKSRLLAGST